MPRYAIREDVQNLDTNTNYINDFEINVENINECIEIIKNKFEGMNIEICEEYECVEDEETYYDIFNNDNGCGYEYTISTIKDTKYENNGKEIVKNLENFNKSNENDDETFQITSDGFKLGFTRYNNPYLNFTISKDKFNTWVRQETSSNFKNNYDNLDVEQITKLVHKISNFNKEIEEDCRKIFGNK